MANEKTPLASSMATVSENLEQAGAAVKDKIKSFVEMAKNGNTSIRGLALIAALALILSSLNELVRGIYTLHPSSALIGLYSFFIGSVAVSMEVDPEAVPFGSKIRKWLLKYLGIVQISTGRGAFYLIAGTLQLTQDTYSATFIGAFQVVVAIVYIVVGRRAVSKVKQLRDEVYPEKVLKQKFETFDKNKDGKLQFEEFYQLLSSLNVEISYQGAELIFVSLDRDMEGGLSFEEFKAFWGNDPLTLVPV